MIESIFGSDESEHEPDESEHEHEPDESEHEHEPDESEHEHEPDECSTLSESESTHASGQSASDTEDGDESWSKQQGEKRCVKCKRSKIQHPKSTHRVELVCDSMPKNVNTSYFARKAAAAVTINRIGATIRHTVNYVQREKKPDDPTYLVIHTGTNHLENEGVYRIMDRFERLEFNLKHHNYKQVAISSIIHRGGASERIHQNIKLINDKLAMMCAKNNWILIDNDNIDEYCLSGDGIHLNGVGDERFTTNILKGINSLVH